MSLLTEHFLSVTRSRVDWRSLNSMTTVTRGLVLMVVTVPVWSPTVKSGQVDDITITSHTECGISGLLHTWVAIVVNIQPTRESISKYTGTWRGWDGLYNTDIAQVSVV